MGPGLIAAWFLVMITMVHSTQSVIQVGFATRDPESAAKAYIWGGLLILPVGFLSAVLGMAAAVLYPDIVPTEALPWGALGLPPLAAGLILAGLWAADVSTASALLMGSATLVCGDIIKRFVAPDLDERGERIVGRVTIAGLSVLTFALAMQISGILKMLLVGLTLSTAYTLIVLMTLFWPSMCRKSSASWTLGMTMVARALWLVAPVVWTGLDWLRGHLMTGFGMGSLAHTQVKYPVVIQIADLAGEYGVTFLIVLVAASLTNFAMSSFSSPISFPKKRS